MGSKQSPRESRVKKLPAAGEDELQIVEEVSAYIDANADNMKEADLFGAVLRAFAKERKITYDQILAKAELVSGASIEKQAPVIRDAVQAVDDFTQKVVARTSPNTRMSFPNQHSAFVAGSREEFIRRIGLKLAKSEGTVFDHIITVNDEYAKDLADAEMPEVADVDDSGDVTDGAAQDSDADMAAYAAAAESDQGHQTDGASDTGSSEDDASSALKIDPVRVRTELSKTVICSESCDCRDQVDLFIKGRYNDDLAGTIQRLDEQEDQLVEQGLKISALEKEIESMVKASDTQKKAIRALIKDVTMLKVERAEEPPTVPRRAAVAERLASAAGTPAARRAKKGSDTASNKLEEMRKKMLARKKKGDQ